MEQVKIGPGTLREIMERAQNMSREEILAERERLARELRESQPRPTVPAPRIPRKFTGRRLTDYVPRTPSQKVALKAVRRFCDLAAEGQGVMLALIGPEGTGKSHLLYGAAHELYRRGLRVYARPWYLLADELRYGRHVEPYEADGQIESVHLEPWQVRAELWRHRIVLIDEVEWTAGSDLDYRELKKFACHAYDNELAVMITTNWNPLKDIIGAPAADRFTEIVINGPSGRKARQHQEHEAT